MQKSQLRLAFRVAAQRNDSAIQILNGLENLSSSPSVFLVKLEGTIGRAFQIQFNLIRKKGGVENESKTAIF